MEEIINNVRRGKIKIKEVFRMIKKDVDLNGCDLIDSTILEELTLLSKVNDILEDTIYMIQDYEDHLEYEKSLKDEK